MRKLLVSLGLVVFVLAGCANPAPDRVAPPGDSAGDSLPALLDAIQKTSDAGSSRLAMDLTFTSPQQTIHVTGEIESVMDPSDPTSLREHAVLNIPSIGMFPGGKVELIVGKGSVLYLRAPMFASFIPAATPWIKLDPASLPQSQGGSLGAATAAVDPAAVLAAIKEALTVEEVGADTVDGSATTHYRATVDTVKLLPLVADIVREQPTDAQLQETKDQLKEAGLDALPIDLWVDGDGFLKQLRMALDLSGLSQDHAAASFSLTLTYSDIGEPVSIDVPPASQVTDISDLLTSALSPTTLS